MGIFRKAPRSVLAEFRKKAPHFEKCQILDDGKTIEFRFGKNRQFHLSPERRYRVPLAYVLSWYEGPHYIKKCRERVSRMPSAPWHHDANVAVHRIRRLFTYQIIRLYLTDTSIYDVAWTLVLETCDPACSLYVGFPRKIGGVTIWKPIYISDTVLTFSERET